MRENLKITAVIHGDSAFIDIPYKFAYMDSEKAVKRKIKRMAKKLKLRESVGPFVLKYDILTKKDDKRLIELLKYCNGSAMRKTARNNYGRSNAHR